LDHYLPYFRQRLITYPLSALLPFQPLFTESLPGDQLLVPPPFSSTTCSFSVPCLLFSFVLFCLQRKGSVCPGGYAGLSQGWLWEYYMMLGVHLLVCISQAGLEPASGGVEALLFFQCNVAWRSFVQDLGFRTSRFWFFLVIFFCQR
jgi:hypothetical protein